MSGAEPQSYCPLPYLERLVDVTLDCCLLTLSHEKAPREKDQWPEAVSQAGSDGPVLHELFDLESQCGFLEGPALPLGRVSQLPSGEYVQ